MLLITLTIEGAQTTTQLLLILEIHHLAPVELNYYSTIHQGPSDITMPFTYYVSMKNVHIIRMILVLHLFRDKDDH